MGDAVRNKLLLCYFGANIGYRAIRYDLKCRDAVVIEIRRKVYDTIDGIGKRSVREVTERLASQGLISFGNEACAV